MYTTGYLACVLCVIVLSPLMCINWHFPDITLASAGGPRKLSLGPHTVEETDRIVELSTPIIPFQVNRGRQALACVLVI